jgi:hypothetical protein
MSPRILLAAILAIGLSTLAQTQPAHGQPGRQPQLQFTEPTDIQGVIEAVMPGGIMVMAANNQAWRVAIPPGTEAKVTGTAKADYLQPGMVVQFKAELDQRGMLKDKVGELTLITTSASKPLGLFLATENAEGDNFGGIAGATGGKTAKRGASAAGMYHITGRLAAGRGGKFSVQTGHGALQMEVAPEATIKIDWSDYLVAVKGDKVSITGLKTAGPPGLAQAQTVSITLVEPLAGVTKKRPAKPDAKKPAKRPKKDKDEGLPEPPEDK